MPSWRCSNGGRGETPSIVYSSHMTENRRESLKTDQQARSGIPQVEDG